MTLFSPTDQVGVARCTVSVALCTCEGGRYIAQQVRSICEQSRPPDQLVVVDDASSDDTLQLVQQVLSAHAPPALRVELHRNPQRLGVARNFEAALRRCDGELIALSDQDDLWPADRLAHMAKLLEADPQVLLVHGDAELIGAEGQPLGLRLFHALGVTGQEFRRLEAGRAFEVLLDRNLVTGAAAMVRSQLVSMACPIPQHWLHDEWLGAVAAALGRLRVTREPVLLYRQHGANQIGAARRTWLPELRRLREPIGLRNSQRYQRALELAQRLDQLQQHVEPERMFAAWEKVAHHAARADLPEWRLARFPHVFREMVRGRYRLYGRGLLGAAADLIATGKHK